MGNEELENTYIEVPTESDYDNYDDDFALGDYAFIGFIAILGCAVFAFVMKTIAKHLQNIHLKVGNKVELGLETKDTTKQISSKESDSK